MNKKPEGHSVGRVTRIFRYPVKSMAGQELQEIDVSWFGLAGDRRWALVRDEARESHFPWLTIRERSDLFRCKPVFTEPEQPDRSPVTVTTPMGKTYDASDPALCHELYPNGARAIKQNRGIFDTFPVSLISSQSINHLSGLADIKPSVQRFRPNLLLDIDDGEPYQEDQWVGRVVRIGSFRMRIDMRNERCAIITVDPDSCERQPEVLKQASKERQSYMGVYGTTVTPGRVAVGDEVVVEQ